MGNETGCSYGTDELAFSLVKPAVLLYCIFKITPCLCFPEQFEPVVSSFSAGQISCQPALSDIPEEILLSLKSFALNGKIFTREFLVLKESHTHS